jgi:hypothetical protein
MAASIAFEIYIGKAGRWFKRIQTTNGGPVLTGLLRQNTLSTVFPKKGERTTIPRLL